MRLSQSVIAGKRKSFLAFIVCAISFTLFSAGCRHRTTAGGESDQQMITVASEASYPPMEFLDDNGEIVGFDIDLIKALAKKTNLKVKVNNVAWEGIFGTLIAGNADVIASSVSITPDRKKQFDFTAPYFKSGIVLVVRSEDKDKYPDLDSLKGSVIGAQIGTTSADLLSSRGIQAKLYNSAGLVFIDLANGNIPAMLMDKPVADYYAAKKPEFAKKFVVTSKMYSDEPLGFVVQKGNTELLNKLNSGLSAVKKDGTLQQLETKWFH
jgi:polar amino acid transport system substrate-binding protein